MKKNNYPFLVLVFAFILIGQHLFSQNILEWNLRTPTASTAKEATFKATLNNSRLDSVTLTRGAGAPANGGCSYGFVGALTVSADKAAAIANNAYYECRIQAKDSFVVYLKSIKANIRIQTYAAKTYQWMYSLDGGQTFTDIGLPVTPGAGEIDQNNGVMQATIDLSGINALQELNALKRVTLRLYGWGGTTPGGSDSNPTYVNFGFGKSTTTVPSLAIEGAVVRYTNDILAWNFYGSDGLSTNYYSTSKNYNVEISNLTRGVGAPGTNGNSNGFSAAMTVSVSDADAVANNTYYEFSLKPKSGATASLSVISANLRAQTYSARTYQWKYSINGGSFINIGSPVTVAAEEINVNNGVLQSPVDLTGIPDLQNVSSSATVTFRLYAWGGSTPAVDASDKTYVNFGFGKSTASVPSLTVGGTVTGDASVPYNIISAWEFSTIGNSTSANPSPVTGGFNATTIDNKLASAFISRGSGIAVSSLYYSYAATSTALSATKDAAIANNEYFQIDVAPGSQAVYTVTGLKFKFRRYAVGPVSYCWQYSTDGLNFTEIANGVFTSVDTNGDVMQPLELSSVAGLQSKTSGLVLRLYLWGATNNTSVFALGRYGAGVATNSVILYGKTETAVPTAADIQRYGKSMWVDSFNGAVAVNVIQESTQNAVVTISDITGHVIYSGRHSIFTGQNRLVLPVTLSKGIYVLSLTTTSISQNIKFIY
jgi:hypothetical protein